MLYDQDAGRIAMAKVPFCEVRHKNREIGLDKSGKG